MADMIADKQKGIIMKKIALLLTIACATQLYGMEKEKPTYEETYGSLLPELKQNIISTALTRSNNLPEAIKIIESASAMYGAPLYNNINDFTKLVHILANKFNTTTLNVAEQLNFPISKKYTELVELAINFIQMYGKESYLFNQWIKDGLDVNATINNDNTSLLMYAASYGNTQAVKLLLNAGANPHYTNNQGQTALDFLLSSHLPIQHPEDIKHYLNEAMQNNPQE